MISWQDAVDMEKIPEQALDNPLYDDLREQILALPDVDAITSYDAVTVEIDLPRKADTFIITAMSREQFSQQLPDNRIAAGTADYDALAEGNGILISDSSDHILSGYDYTTQIGDVLHLKTYGGQDMDLNVMGIVKEGSRMPPACWRHSLFFPRRHSTNYTQRSKTSRWFGMSMPLKTATYCVRNCSRLWKIRR